MLTIRYRDSMDQKRIKISEIKEIINKEISMKNILKNI